jgi:hypothetical protein
MAYRLTVLTLAASAGLALTGCMITPTGTSVNPPASHAPRSSPTATLPYPSPSAEAAALNPKFGETESYEDGVTLTLSAPQPLTPSDYAAGATNPVNLRFTITIHNGSSKNFSPALVSVTASSGGKEGSQIFDSGANNLGMHPSTDVLPGGDISWDVGFSVMDQASTIVQIRPGMAYQETIFTN